MPVAAPNPAVEITDDRGIGDAPHRPVAAADCSGEAAPRRSAAGRLPVATDAVILLVDERCAEQWAQPLGTISCARSCCRARAAPRSSPRRTAGCFRSGAPAIYFNRLNLSSIRYMKHGTTDGSGYRGATGAPQSPPLVTTGVDVREVARRRLAHTAGSLAAPTARTRNFYLLLDGRDCTWSGRPGGAGLARPF